MIRVGSLERSIEFYKNALGMHELRRENFTGGKFTLVFLGYGDEASDAVIELTYNWDEDKHDLGTGYGHVVLIFPKVIYFLKHIYVYSRAKVLIFKTGR